MRNFDGKPGKYKLCFHEILLSKLLEKNKEIIKTKIMDV